MKRCSGKKHSDCFIRENPSELRERRFWEWKFENDNGSNQKILIARQYVENWADMKRKNVGLLLMDQLELGKVSLQAVLQMHFWNRENVS